MERKSLDLPMIVQPTRRLAPERNPRERVRKSFVSGGILASRQVQPPAYRRRKATDPLPLSSRHCSRRSSQAENEHRERARRTILLSVAKYRASDRRTGNNVLILRRDFNALSILDVYCKKLVPTKLLTVSPPTELHTLLAPLAESSLQNGSVPAQGRVLLNAKLRLRTKPSADGSVSHHIQRERLLDHLESAIKITTQKPANRGLLRYSGVLTPTAPSPCPTMTVQPAVDSSQDLSKREAPSVPIEVSRSVNFGRPLPVALPVPALSQQLSQSREERKTGVQREAVRNSQFRVQRHASMVDRPDEEMRSNASTVVANDGDDVIVHELDRVSTDEENI